jgi:hypothetical protein
MAKGIKKKGYAKRIAGYAGQKYALYRNRKRVGTSSMTGSDAAHKAELVRSGYRIVPGDTTK